MGSWYINKIIIDSRERVRGYNAYNYYVDTYEVQVESLKYGDYMILTNGGAKVVFEFKNCNDFIKSMEDKSLFQELSNQTMNYEYSYLIICGDFEETFEYLYWNVPHYRYKYKTMQLLNNRLNSQVKGALARIYAMYIPIIFVETEEQAFAEMVKISSKIADAKKYGGVVRPSPKKLEENPVSFFLCGINGIGDKKSKAIIDKFNIECLDDLCTTTADQLLSVDRVTERNVREIWRKVHNEEIDL